MRVMHARRVWPARRAAPSGRRDADRAAPTELVQAMRGRAVAAEREARQQRPEKAGTTVSVAGSTVSLSVTVQGGGSGNAGAELLGAMPEIEKRLTAAIELGTNRLLGLDPGRITEIPELLGSGPRPDRDPPPLWDGAAGERIAGLLADT